MLKKFVKIWESLIYSVNVLCRNLLSVCNLELVLSLRNAVFHFFAASTLFPSPCLLLQQLLDFLW